MLFTQLAFQAQNSFISALSKSNAILAVQSRHGQIYDHVAYWFA